MDKPPQKPIEIKICMGSSCFSRGNNKTLAVVKEFVDSSPAPEMFLISGALCEGKCSTGPHITINGCKYNNITPEMVIDIIESQML